MSRKMSNEDAYKRQILINRHEKENYRKKDKSYKGKKKDM